MKIPSFKRDNGSKAVTEFVCKECKMVFNTKDSLEQHKRKSQHSRGMIYFGKHDK
jgi:Zinc finger, C2H2 type